MYNFYKSDSVLFKIFACFISFVLVVGCVFVPKSAFAFTPEEMEEPSVTDYNQSVELLLDPSAHNYDNWFDLENDEDPYGNKPGDSFMMLEQNEVFSLRHYNKNDIDEICSMYGDYTPGSTGKFVDVFKNTDKAAESGIPSDIMWSDAIQTVAFSPSSDFPQKDHIAVIGFIWDNKNKQVRLWVYNARDNKWSDSKTIGNLSWADVDGTSFYGDLEPYMSITAGDYNGDHKDSVVTYFGDCNNGDYGITEWAISDGPDGKPSINQASKDSKFSLLNQSYAAGGVDNMKKIYNSTDHQAAGKGSLHAILKTGDFDGDGIDDVAALSALEFYKSDHAKQYDWRLGIPYLAICNGKANGAFLNGEAYYGAYVGKYDETAKTSDTVNIANFAVARLSKHGTDSIIVGGVSWHFEGNSDGKLKSTSHTNDLKMARYDLSQNKDTGGNVTSEDFGMFSFVNQCYDSNGSSSILSLTNMAVHDYSLKCNYERNYAWNPICAQAVYMNGKGNDPYILMDGDLYYWKDSSPNPQKVFDFSGMDGDNYEHFAQHFCPLACTCAGSWDGNDNGYEQVVFGMCSRQGGTDQDDDDYRVAYITIGINPEMHDVTTGLPNGVNQPLGENYYTGYSNNLFFSTAENGKNSDDDYVINDKGAESGHGLHFSLCNFDYRDDGLTAKYDDFGVIYSDPVVQYILQAAPYWQGTESSSAGETRFEKTVAIAKEITNSNQVSQETGFNVGASFSGKRVGIGGALKSGSSQGYKNSFSEKIGVEYSIQDRATTDTTVTISRYPFYYYNYWTYDTDAKEWKQDMCVSSLVWNRVLTVALTTDWYNIYVDRYNEKYETICADNQNLYNSLSGAEKEKYSFLSEKILAQPGGKLDHLDAAKDSDLFYCDGNPSAYKRIDNGKVPAGVTEKTGAITLTQDGWEDGPSVDLKGSNSWETQRGLSFGYDINLDFHNDDTKRHKRNSWHFNVGIYSDFGEMWGRETTNSKGYTAGLHYKTSKSPKKPSGGYYDPISCVGGWWYSSIHTNHEGEADKLNPNDHNALVPVVGYVVNLLKFDEPEVPNLINLTYEVAKSDLNEAGFQIKNDGYEYSTVIEEKDKVCRQDPEAGEHASMGSIVKVYLSKGEINDLEIIETNTGTTTETKKTTTDGQARILDNFIGPVLAFAGEDENNCLKLSWNVEDNPSDCLYQVYTSINGEIYKVGNPVNKNEFSIDLDNPSSDMKEVVEKLKNQELPIYQFAISVINPNGVESPKTGWVYFCSSKNFREAISCYVSRNKREESNNRLKLFIKRNGQNPITKFVDGISLRRDAHFVCSRWSGNTEINDLGLKDSFPYVVDGFQFIECDGTDALYEVKLVSKTNSDDVKKCVIRMNDGKIPIERLTEAEILSNWRSPEEITEAINNPETHQAAVDKLNEIYKKINYTPGMQVSGEAKDVYVAGIRAYNHYYGFDKQKFDAMPVVVTIVAGCLLIAIVVCLFFFFNKRKTAKAGASEDAKQKKMQQAKTNVETNNAIKTETKDKSKSKYGTY